MVVMMLYNEWAIVEDMVDVVVFVELQIARLASNSSSTEKGFVVSISS